MMQPGLAWKLFVVPLAENNHGKTRIVCALVNQGLRESRQKIKRGPYKLMTAWGHSIDALIIPRSYQETLDKEYGNVPLALEGVDPHWRTRQIIVFPSHLKTQHCAAMISSAKAAGFNTVAVSVLLQPGEISKHEKCLALDWDQRWCLSNPFNENPTPQLNALGIDLWVRISCAAEGKGH